MNKIPSILQLGNRNVVNKNNKNNNQKTFTTMKNNMNFYQVTTVDNALSIIVKSPMLLNDITGYLSMKLLNGSYITIKQLEVKHCENAIIDREAVSIIHNTWKMIKEEKKKVKVSNTALIAVPKDILKHLSIWDNRILVESFYEDKGGASKEYRIFAYIVDMCDNLDIELSYAGTRNDLILNKDKDKISLQKDDGFIHIQFVRYINEVTTKVINF